LIRSSRFYPRLILGFDVNIEDVRTGRSSTDDVDLQVGSRVSHPV
jgi:hypothetical protein